MSQRTFAFMNRVLTYDMRSIPIAIQRLLALGAIILFVYIIQNEMSNRTGQGLILFQAIIYANLFLIVFISLNDYASVITEEKEHQMLGLLLMTGIKPIGLLLGKSLPRQINSLLLILIQFPFTLLSITLGGVTANQVVAAYVTLFGFMFFVANLALLFSVLSEDNKTARGSTFTVLILLFIFPSIISLIGALVFSPLLWVGGFLQTFLPTTRISEIMQTGFQGSPVGFQFYLHVLAGGVCIFLSWLVFENLVLLSESTETSKVEKSRPFKKQKKAGKKQKPELLRRPSMRVSENALGWKHYFFSLRGPKGIKTRFLIFGIILSFVALSQFVGMVFRLGISFSIVQWLNSIGGTALFIAFIGILVEPVINIHRLFSQEIEQHTYPGIYMLPMTLKQKSWQMFKGGLPMMIPSIVLFIIGFLLYPKGVLGIINDLSRERLLFKVPIIAFSFYCCLLATAMFSSLHMVKGSIFSSWPSFKSQGTFALLLLLYAVVVVAIFSISHREPPSGYEFVILNVFFTFFSLKLIKKALIFQGEK